MKIRHLLLASTVIPFAFSQPSWAAEPAPDLMILAQTEEACPEGAECPPTDTTTGEEAAPGVEATEEPAASDTPATEEAPAAAEQAPAATDEAPAQEPAADAAEEPAAGQGDRRERARERARRQQEQLQQQSEPAQEAPAAEEAPAGSAATEEPAGETAAEEPAAETQAPAAEQPAAAETQEAEQPASREDRRRQRALERAQRRQQQLQEGETATETAPAEAVTQEEPSAQPEAGEPATAEATADTATEPASTVEQQLEAQGDQEEANKVRELRRKLRRERAEAEGEAPAAEVEAGAEEETTDRDRAERREERRRERRERREGEVVEERGDRIIIDLGGGNLVIEREGPDEGERLLYGARDVDVEYLPGGETRTTVYRENGSQIVTVRNRNGDIITRTRITPNGREVVLIDNRIPVIVDGAPPAVFRPVELPPLVVEIPREEYIVDLGRADEQEIEEVLLAPPVETVERAYTLEEVTRNERVRDKMRRIDLDTITFEFGSATISSDQMRALNSLGAAIEEVIAENPDEVYLIEGHTDAVGSDYDNLILSDQRAEAVAVALSQNFDVPPENLVTEGYGEQYLKVPTEAPERANRRVTVRRITPLLSAEAQ